jgi:uncharacterized protein YdbL (DUF1318 family)
VKKAFAKGIVSGLCALLAACAFITVNVYFPEKDVKKAYKSLDDMLLKQGDHKDGGTDGTGPAETPNETDSKPVSMHRGETYRLAFVQEAFAQDDISDELAAELAKMPEVQQAYADIRARIPQLKSLRDSGAVGEGNGGNLVVLDKAKLGNNQEVVDAVNNDRKTVIFAMAKATLKITGQPENSATMKKALKDAAKTFAAVRQEKAKPGWFIQLPNGRWVQK